MTLYASWIHGNAVTVENPGSLNRVGHYGWGGDMAIKPGQSSWFHIPLPTPVIAAGVRTKLQRVFMNFKAESCSIRNVHVYDGSSKVHDFNDLFLEGEHRLTLDSQNTFQLPTPYTVVWGIGISFFVVSSIGFDTRIPDARLIIEAAGGDYAI
jgi:hypothetical protein